MRVLVAIAAEKQLRPEAVGGKRAVQASTTKAAGAKRSGHCGDENNPELSYYRSAAVLGRVCGVVRVDAEEPMPVAGDISSNSALPR